MHHGVLETSKTILRYQKPQKPATISTLPSTFSTVSLQMRFFTTT